jgi:hypothetical protein
MLHITRDGDDNGAGTDISVRMLQRNSYLEENALRLLKGTDKFFTSQLCTEPSVLIYEYYVRRSQNLGFDTESLGYRTYTFNI